MPTEQNNNDDPQQDRPDYEKLIPRKQGGTEVGSGMANDRDLGSVGGGSIPSSGTTTGGMSTSSSTVDSGGRSTGARAGLGSPVDRGGMSDVGANSTTNANAVEAQGNIGGRNPGQPQTAMGEQDPRGQRDPVGDPSADPMSARTPDSVQQRKDQDKQAKEAQEKQDQ